MGACYAVTCKLKFNIQDEPKVLAKMKEQYQKDLSKGIGFCLDEYSFAKPESVEDFMALYFVEHQDMYDFDRTVLKNGNVIYLAKSGFDARYGWEMVMENFFMNLEGLLMRGSILDMYPDNDHITYRVKEGKVY